MHSKSGYPDMERHREGEVVVRPLREAPECMEAGWTRENLVRMLRCIGHLQSSRGERETRLVPGSATFDKNGVAELTFYQGPVEKQDESVDGGGDIAPTQRGDDEGYDEGTEEGDTVVALPEVAQPFATLLAVQALWLDRSERVGEALETKVLRVLDPVVIDDMLRRKQYTTWSVGDAIAFAYSIPFEPPERGAWCETELVAEWKENVQHFRAHRFIADLLVTGAIEVWPLARYVDRQALWDVKTVTYDCLKRQDVRRGTLYVDGWPMNVESV